MSVCGFSIGNESCYIGLARKGGIDVIQNEVSSRKNELLVAFNGKERFLCAGANTQIVTNARNTISQIKRLVGRKFTDKDVQTDIKHFPFTVKQGEGGMAVVEVSYNDKKTTFTPQQILAMIVKRLGQTAEWANDGIRLADVVISVPAYFTDVQRQAMLDATKIAGIQCIRLFNEGTAIALSYGIYRSAHLPETDPVNVMFVDMGHSQLTATVVSFLKGKLTVRSTAYDSNLGGRNIDILLFDHFVGEIKKKYKMDITGNAKAEVRLLAACEKLKKTLSGNSESTISVECLQDDKDVSFPFSRAEMEKLMEPFAARIAAPIKQAVEESGLKFSDIPTIEIVGGSMRVPFVKKVILETTGKTELSTTLNLDEAVARGCALQAAMLSPLFKVREFIVNDICVYPISVSWQAIGASASASASSSNNSSDAMEVEASADDHQHQGQGSSLDAAAGTTKSSSSTLNNLFPLRSGIPSNKVITFPKRTSDQIDVTAYYEKPSMLPEGIPASIGKYSITKIPADANKVKLKVKLDIHGIVRVDTAQALTDYEVEEPVAPEPTKTPAAGAAAGAGAPAAAAGDSGDVSKTDAADKMNVDGAAAAGSAAPAMVKKIKTRRTDLPIDAYSSGLMPKAIEGMVEMEGQMASQDKLLQETANAKNALEAYALDMRSKVQGEYSAFATESERTEFSKLCDAAEDWLYGDGEDASKSVYLEKLATLQKVGDPIKKRKVEREVLPHTLKELEALITEFRAFLNVEDVEQSEKDKVGNECNTATTFVQQTRSMIDTTPATENLKVSAKDVEAKKTALSNVCRPIIKNPKKIKKEEPAAAAAAAAPPPTTEPATPADQSQTPKKDEDSKMDVDN